MSGPGDGTVLERMSQFPAVGPTVHSLQRDDAMTALGRNLLSAAVLTIATATLAACGGGGSTPPASGGSNPPPQAKPTAGTVAISLRDAPTDAFCHIYADIERIDLLGEDGPTHLAMFGDPSTDGRFDLLALQNQSQLLTVATEVPIGGYEKIRLTLDQLSLVGCEMQGGQEVAVPEEDWEHPKIPGNGKLDLVPRGGIEVIGGETLLVELDMDMDKSLHLRQTGQGNGKWQFRPVVFVTVTPDSSRLVRVFGRVRDSNGGQSPFELCPVDGTAPPAGDDMSQDDDSGRCLDVFLRAPGTLGTVRVFDDQGNAGTFADSDLLTAIGFLGLHDDDDDDDGRQDDLKLDALVLQVGPAGSFESLLGDVATERRGDGVFALDAVPEDANIEALLDVAYQGGPILGLKNNSEVGPEVILPGAALEVNGVFADPTTQPKGEPLKATLMLLEAPGAGADVSVLDATITEILEDAADENPDGRQVTVQTAGDPPVDHCVKTLAGTRYLLIDENGPSSTTTEIAFDDLALDDAVDVFGAYEEPVTSDSCVIADTIQKYAPAAP